jgi:hypothetical protein
MCIDLDSIHLMMKTLNKMKKRIIILYIFMNLINGLSYSQTSIQDVSKKVDNYKSDSKVINNMVRVYSDSCNQIFNCTFPKKIKLFKINEPNDSNVFVLQHELLVDSNSTLDYIKMDYVILMSEGVKIILKRELLFNTYLVDSIEYLGKYNFDSSLDDFESCILSKNIIISLKFKFNNPIYKFEYRKIPVIYDEGRWRWYLFWRNYKKKSN